MVHSRKRRPSMSPSRTQPSDVSEYKKRKYNSNVVNGGAQSKPITRPVPRLSERAASDSSTTLDGDAPPFKDKGKAVEKDPLLLELERLRKEVAHKNELLDKGEKTVAAISQALTCQICLELLNRPYALAPCGHVSCHSCLVSWFTAPHNDHAGDEDNPDEAWYSDDSGSSASDQPEFDDDAPPVNGNVEPNPDPSNGHADVANGNPASGAPPPPAAPVRSGYPNSVNRRKTCPHCRCVVEQRPIQVYILKDLIGLVDSPACERRKENDKKDPWRGIFRPLQVSTSVNGIGGGPGGGIQGEHVGHNTGNAGGHANADYEESDEEIDGTWHGFTHARVGAFGIGEPQMLEYALPHPPPVPPPPPPPFIDEEDGVRRCGSCLHEIWHGQCTNPLCGVAYGDGSEAGSEAGSNASAGHHDESSHHDDEEGDEVGWIGPSNHDADADDDDDGYESSFIDDADHRGRLLYHPEVLEASDSDGEDFLPGPSRRFFGRNILETSAISSDDNGDEDESSGPSTIVRRRRRLIDEEEELQVEEDVRSGNDHENGVHTSEGVSSAYHLESPSFAGPSANNSVPVIDDDYEDYGEPPYVWEEEESDGENRQGSGSREHDQEYSDEYDSDAY